jgi:hypothetical protein
MKQRLKGMLDLRDGHVMLSAVIAVLLSWLRPYRRHNPVNLLAQTDNEQLQVCPLLTEEKDLVQ